MPKPCLIVGAGHSGGQLAARLRQSGFENEILLVGAEAHLPYQRPPLSKDYLAGAIGLERVHLRSDAFYRDNAIEAILGTSVTAVDRAARRVTLDDGRTLDYGQLVLATGSRPRRLEVPGGELEGVHYLRTIEDSDALRARLEPGARLAIVGGGYIGLEVAAVAAIRGVAVTVLEMAPRLLSRVTGPEVADFYRRAHEQAGVTVHAATRVERFEGGQRVQAVHASGGLRFEADAVLVGVGIVPNAELAAGAGLAVDDGVVVDEHGMSGDSRIFASGDCSAHPNALYGRRLRLECVQNGMAQAKVVADNLCGRGTRYDEVPWFWSDQYDLKLQIAGLLDGYDQSVVRGRADDGSFSVFYLKEGGVIAVDSVNAMKDHLAARKLVAKRARIGAEQLRDPSSPLAIDE